MDARSKQMVFKKHRAECGPSSGPIYSIFGCIIYKFLKASFFMDTILNAFLLLFPWQLETISIDTAMLQD